MSISSRPSELQITHSGLLNDFPPRCGLDIGVAGFDVPARLQPFLELRVVYQEQRQTIGREDEPAGGEVAGIEVETGESVAGRVQESQHRFAIAGFAIVKGLVSNQQRSKRPKTRISHQVAVSGYWVLGTEVRTRL